MLNKVQIRKDIAKLGKGLRDSDNAVYLLSLIKHKRDLLKNADFINNNNLPTLGKLRLILERDLKTEQSGVDGKLIPSANDLKRLALKSAVYDYYMDLPYPPETVAVDHNGDLTARRDNKEYDNTDVDLAPKKNDIYMRWMEKLSKLIRENRLDKSEYDESAERGIPQGGAFEKQLDRYRVEYMKKLWEDYYKNDKVI